MDRFIKRFLLLILTLAVYAQSAAETSTYVVGEGETLASILRSQQFGEAYAGLLPYINRVVEMNPEVFPNGNADFMLPGATLRLPENPNAPQPEPEPVPEPEPIPEPEPMPEPEPEPEPEIPVIGQIQVTGGPTDIRREGETTEVTDREDLFSNDVILTGDNAVAEITLVDETRISVGPNSEFAITEFSYTAPATLNDSPLGALVVSLRNGVVRAITGLIGKNKANRYAINSSLTSTIGIRGTDFTVRSCNDVSACGDLYGVSVAVQEGKISLKNQTAELELDVNEFAQVQSTTESPAKAPLPEGFFDLQRDVTQINVQKSWWQESIDWLKSLF